MEIIINNWEEYQTRNDLKSMHWFRVESDLPFNQKFFNLSIETKWFFIFLLCLCAKKMTQNITLDFKYCSTMSGIPEKNILNIIKSLEDAKLITRTRNELVTDTHENVPTEQNRTEQNRTVQNTTYCSEQINCSKPLKIIFNENLNKFENITENHGELWSNAYPAVNLETELNAMCAWLKANPKNKKSNYERFITSWLKRSQDKARRV